MPGSRSFRNLSASQSRQQIGPLSSRYGQTLEIPRRRVTLGAFTRQISVSHEDLSQQKKVRIPLLIFPETVRTSPCASRESGGMRSSLSPVRRIAVGQELRAIQPSETRIKEMAAVRCAPALGTVGRQRSRSLGSSIKNSRGRGKP